MTRAPAGGANRSVFAFALVAGLVILATGVWTLLAPEPVIELEWIEAEGYRWAALSPPDGDGVGFESLDASSLGIDFRNTLSQEAIVENRNLLNGSGVAIGDVTGDGRPDIYLTRLEGPNALYENLGGWRFQDVTAAAGVALPGQYSTGTSLADLDGDGDLDLIVSANDAPARLFLNDGSGAFTERPGAFGSGGRGGTSLALGDMDADGDLDVYLTNYKRRSVRDLWPDEQEFRFIVEQVGEDFRVREKYREHYRLSLRDSILVWFEEGEPDQLFRNEGRGQFEEMPLTGGVLLDASGTPVTEPLRDWGLHARFEDIDGDGLADLYVANDFESPDRMWRNLGDGRFRAFGPLTVRKQSLSAMAVDFADVDRDGDRDFFVVEMLSRDHEQRLRQMGTLAPPLPDLGVVENQPQYMGNMLFLNRGDGSWAEVGEQAGVRRSGWTWSTQFMDVDLDGYSDILLSTGHHYDVQDLDANQEIRRRIAMGQLDREREMLLYPPLQSPNAGFRNRGDGTFEHLTSEWGFRESDVAHGIAVGDLDGDGAPDLVMNRLGSDVAVFRNVTGGARVAIRLEGEAPNTEGVGATVRLIGGPVVQEDRVAGSGTYLSGSERTLTFAAGDGGGPLQIEVEWPDGRMSVISDAAADRIYEVWQSSASPGTPGAPDPTPEAAPLFVDASPGVEHRENAYRDFEYHPLLPYRLSRLGPGVAWFDPDGDGLDDLFLGNGGGAGITRLANRGGRLVADGSGPLSAPGAQDATGIVGWVEDGVARLLVGHSALEAGEGAPPEEAVSLWEYSGGRFRRGVGIDSWGASVGPLALTDLDGDGRLDLFVGGRATARYPEPASSLLLRNLGGGRFEPFPRASAALDELGLVTGAVFSDLDGDGTPELILAREWGTLLVMAFRDGRLLDVSERWGVPAHGGLWNGVTTGDLNGDGRLDVVATNWGRNHLYAATSDTARPSRIRFADFDGDGDLELLETYFGGATGAEVPRRKLAEILPEFRFIQNRVRTHEAFAESTLEEVFGVRLPQTSVVEAGFFDHVVLWNRGDHFDVESLPSEAQQAPGYHVSVADMDGDGNHDIFMSQNLFSYRPEVPRSDAGRALLLLGDGNGGLVPLPGQRAGIEVWGEQRGAGVADMNADGRLDVAVSQNGAETRVLLNRGGTPGLRIRLNGPATNPRGIGAQVHMETPEGRGPTRELLAGSGYWSSDSVVLVLATPPEGSRVRVRWPDGEELAYPVPASASEIVVGRDGTVEVVR